MGVYPGVSPLAKLASVSPTEDATGTVRPEKYSTVAIYRTVDQKSGRRATPYDGWISSKSFFKTPEIVLKKGPFFKTISGRFEDIFKKSGFQNYSNRPGVRVRTRLLKISSKIPIFKTTRTGALASNSHIVDKSLFWTTWWNRGCRRKNRAAIEAPVMSRNTLGVCPTRVGRVGRLVPGD